MRTLSYRALFSTMLLTGVVLGQPAQARDTLLNLNAQAALEKGRQTGDILSDVKVYFAGETTPTVEKKMGEFKSNKKTNAFNKSDEEACQWAFFSAVKSLQERALKEGGNAVVDVKSNYRDKEFVSATEFQCGAGAFIGGVALKGTVAKLK
jgi:uncharacterized protein YbjQ (UPF0145 family)